MSLFLKPKCLTTFLKFNKYEIYCLNEEYENNGVKTNEKTAINEDDKNLFEIMTEESLLSKEDKSLKKIPKFVRVSDEQILPSLKNENFYDPLEEAPSLYTELDKIEYYDLPSLKKFLSDFGIPWGSDLRSYDPRYVCNFEMNVFNFYELLVRYKHAFRIFKALQIHDEDEINYYASTLEDRLDHNEMANGLHTYNILSESNRTHLFRDIEKFEKIIEGFKEVKDWESFPQESVEVRAKYHLVELLNRQNKGSYSYTMANNQIQPATTFSNLFEVAYFQLSRAVINNVEMRECDCCGYLFEATHSSMRFCPPHPGIERSNCQNTYNQRAKRKRRKAKELAKNLFEQGNSLEEITQQIKDYDSTEIQSWINR